MSCAFVVLHSYWSLEVGYPAFDLEVIKFWAFIMNLKKSKWQGENFSNLQFHQQTLSIITMEFELSRILYWSDLDALKNYSPS